MRTESIPQTVFYISVADALETQGWRLHRNHRGVFVMANEPKKYHSIVLTDYSLGRGGREALVPRFEVNKLRTGKELPSRVKREWGINSHCGISRIVNLEITFLSTELPQIIPFLSGLLERIEAGAVSEMEKVFQIPFQNTSNTNLWTSAAKDYAHKHALATEAYRR